MRIINVAVLTLAGLAFLPLNKYLANERPPAGSMDASCSYGSNTPKYCKVKVVSARNRISIWYPEGRQSAMTSTYSGNCLKPGCVLIGPDFGYPERQKVILFKISKKIISWKDLNGNKLVSTFTITSY